MTPEHVLRRTFPWIVPVMILLTWQAGSALGFIRANILPAPSAVAAGQHFPNPDSSRASVWSAVAST